MSCFNSGKECYQEQSSNNKCHDSYKKTECFECDCHKKNMCENKKSMGYNYEKPMVDMRNYDN